MQITGVFPFAHRNYIAFDNLDTLKDALRLFASGQTKGSQATRNELVSAGGIGGAFTVLVGINRDDSEFLTRLFAEIDERVGPQGRRQKAPEVGAKLSKSYDYDGVGPFFKAGVDVVYAGDSTYLLSLYAAYVGNEVEIGLADHLGVERCVMHKGVRLDVEPTGETFSFDLDVLASGLIAANLDFAEHFQHMDGETLGMILEAARDGNYAPIGGNDDFILEMAYVNVEKGWERNGAIVTGSLYNKNKYYDDKPVEWVTPGVSFTLKRNNPGSRFNPLPTTDPALVTKLDDMATAIENSFK